MSNSGKTTLAREILIMALQALGANRLRSILTILGITIGVFSVVGVMTTLSAVKQSIDTGLSVFAANVFELSKYPAIRVNDSWRKYRNRQNISPRQAYQFAAEMESYGVPVTIYGRDGGERVRYRDKATNPRIRIYGTNENFLLTHKYELSYGRNITASDIEFNRPVIVIGHETEQTLFPNENPIGKTVIADGSKYSVVGVLKERGKLFGSSMDNLVIIPVTRFVANNWHHRRSMDISILAPDAQWVNATEDLAIGIFRQVRNLMPEEENDFEVFSNDSLQAAFAKFAVVIGTGGLMISAIALLCAGVGIMNIMLVSVTERTREIGLRKSLGARKGHILSQFLLEAIALSLIGGAIGIFLGWAAGNFVAAKLGVPMIIPWFWIATAISVCSAIGIFFGFFPALKAASLKPIDALRYE